MNDVDRLILEAWEKLGPKIMGDGEELQRRLGRRRSALLTRPPRGWCLAVRACDTRITPAHWVITPEHALDLDHPEHPYEPIEHEVIIRPHALRKYCRAVRTDSWGEEVGDVCRQLGTSRAVLLHARWAGVFRERFVKGLGGKWGKYPVPLIHSWTALDPGGTRHFGRPDSLWGSLWEFLADMVPDDFEQSIIRRPRFGRFGPHCKEDAQLIGWRWVCPGCSKEVRKIYYPLPPRTVFDFLGYDPGSGKTGRSACPTPKKFLRYDVNRMEAPPPTFACYNCHRVRGMNRTNDGGWNEVVSWLTRGMLYGHEVEKPQWYRTMRKNARARQLNRPAPKREAVMRRMANGWRSEEIARDLWMKKIKVDVMIGHICRQEGVKDRRELGEKLGWKHEQPLNVFQKRIAVRREREEQIRELLLEGLRYRDIGVRVGVSENYVSRAAARIYARHGIGPRVGRRGLAAKLGAEIGGRYAIEREVRERLLAGQKYGEIMAGMGMSKAEVSGQCVKIYKREGVRRREELIGKMQKSGCTDEGRGSARVGMGG